MNNENDQIRNYELYLKLLEESINSAEQQELNSLIADSPEVARQYNEFIIGYVRMQKKTRLGTSSLNVLESIIQQSLWEELAEDEKTAPAIEIELPEPERAVVKISKREKQPRQINKYSLYTAIISVAAVIFLLIYIKFVPPAASTVATIKDVVNAEWGQGDPADIGDRLWSNEGARWLKKGAVKIVFDYGAEVIVEGPVEFELESADKMIVNSGRLFATVQSGATGFTVQTPSSTVIDLGTEFGVEVGYDGSTDVHMFKGKASLIPGRIGEKQEGLGLLAGQARAVAKTGKVKPIELEDQAFVREFDSKKQFLWRGEPVNLADIVGGGDGFGTGGRDYGVSVNEDKVYEESLYIHEHPDFKASGFHPISSIDGIDGTFIPDSSRGPVTISSGGDIFKECPDTSGISGAPIINGARTKLTESLTITYPDGQLQLAGVESGTDENPSIFMHANSGITFDLEKIRSILPEGVQACRFTTLAGVPNNHAEVSCLDIWVLVDGQVQFSETKVRAEQTFNIDVPLTGMERFLTFVITDGTEGGRDSLGSRQGYDWCLFSQPYLELVSGK